MIRKGYTVRHKGYTLHHTATDKGWICNARDTKGDVLSQSGFFALSYEDIEPMFVEAVDYALSLEGKETQ